MIAGIKAASNAGMRAVAVKLHEAIAKENGASSVIKDFRSVELPEHKINEGRG